MIKIEVERLQKTRVKQKTENWFFKKINESNQLLARVTKKKEHSNYWRRYERGVIITELPEDYKEILPTIQQVRQSKWNGKIPRKT